MSLKVAKWRVPREIERPQKKRGDSFGVRKSLDLQVATSQNQLALGKLFGWLQGAQTSAWAGLLGFFSWPLSLPACK